MHRFLLVVAAGLLVSCRDAAQPTVPAEVAATPAASAPYTFLDLGSLEGYTEAAAINDAGQVVGRSATASGELRAFRWTDGTMEDIGPNAGIAPVLKRFLAHYWGRHRDPTTPVPSISKGTLWALGAHAWPANVRELQNVIEHAVVLLEPGAEVRPEDIPFIESAATDPEKLADEEPDGDAASYYAARDRLLARFDRRYLTRVVMRAGGNLSKAARLAQVDRTTFYRLMERHGLQRDLLTGGAE